MKIFIQFGEVFKTVQVFECKNLLILKFRKFSTFTGGCTLKGLKKFRIFFFPASSDRKLFIDSIFISIMQYGVAKEVSDHYNV